MYTFSAERLRISAVRSRARWLHPLKPGGERKAEDVRQKTYTLIYPDLQAVQNWRRIHKKILVTYKWTKLARVLVRGKPLQPSG
jgi:hypothetical protein